MNVMDFWSTHGLNDLEEDIEIRKLTRRVAHLQAIADISDRVIGNQDVYYDLFDGTNDHSPGKVDLTRVEGVSFSAKDTTTMTFKKDGINQFIGFKVGQEVTIHNDTTKHTAIIKSITNDVSPSLIKLEIQGVDTNGTYTICRSMINVVDGKCYLSPPNFLEHDIRINIDLGESQTYTLISWVEHEKDMNLSKFTANNTEVPVVRTMSNIANIPHRPMKVKAEQDNTSIKISWSNPEGKNYTVCVFKRDEQEPLFEGKNAIEFIDPNPSVGKNSYEVFYKTEEGAVSKSVYCEVDFVDTIPPQNVSSIRTGYAYVSEESVRVTYDWTNPTDEDFKEVFFKVDEEIIYTGKNNHFSFIAETEKSYKVEIGVRDIYGNEQSINHPVSPISPLKYWGVKIDFSKTNDPTDSVEYIGLAKGMTPANKVGLGEDWSNTFPFKDIKVCMLDNVSGKFLGYVNQNDYSHMENGSDNIWYRRPTAKTMTEIPTIYTHSYTDENGVIYIKFSDHRILDCYTALSHKGKSGIEDYLYISSYPLNKECTCVSGESPISYSYSVFNNLLGGNYFMWKYPQIDLIQKLKILAYKSLDSITTLGKGFVGIPVNGKFDNCGLVYGDPNGEGVKFLGLEHLWGGISQYIKDFSLTDENKIKSSVGEQEPTIKNITIKPSDQSIGSVVGDNAHTFIATNEKHASEGTFFVDRVFLDNTNNRKLGIYNLDLHKALDPEMWITTYSPNTSLGIFSTMFVPMTTSDVNNNIGCRCAVLGRRE